MEVLRLGDRRPNLLQAARQDRAGTTVSATKASYFSTCAGAAPLTSDGGGRYAGCKWERSMTLASGRPSARRGAWAMSSGPNVVVQHANSRQTPSGSKK